VFHYEFGGSNAARDLKCTGNRALQVGLPKTNAASIHTASGNLLHDCLEDMLLSAEPDPRSYIGKADTIDGFEVEVSEDDVADKLIPLWDAWLELRERYGLTEWEPEVHVRWAEKIGGHADFIATGPDVVVIGDWKTGMGVSVSAENSAQGQFYAMAGRAGSSCADMFEGRSKIVVAILQPNRDGGSALKTWETTPEGLDSWQREYLRAVEVGQTAKGTLSVGSHCAFCPAAAICPEKTGKALKALQMDPEKLQTLSESLALVDEIKAWCTTVEATAWAQLDAGSQVPGWKLVPKRATEKWIDEELALKALRRTMGGKKLIVTEKLLSPTQMRKAAKAAGKTIDLTELTVKASSGTTIAPESDKRDAVPSGKALEAALASIS